MADNTGRWPIAPVTPEAKPPRTASERPAGRIVHDERGNAVWNWGGDMGRASLDSTSAMLKRLEVPELKMEGQEEMPPTAQIAATAPIAARAKDTPPPDMGYNPYDQRMAVRKPTLPKGPVGRRKR